MVIFYCKLRVHFPKQSPMLLYVSIEIISTVSQRVQTLSTLFLSHQYLLLSLQQQESIKS